MAEKKMVEMEKKIETTSEKQETPANSSTYHLCVHSDLVDVDGAVETILAYLENIK